MGPKELRSEVAARTGLFLTERDVERVLAALQATGDIWKIVEYSRTPMRVVCTLLDVLQEHGLVTVQDQQLVLTEQGTAFCHTHRIAPFTAATCPTCQGRGVVLDLLGDVRDRFYDIARRRPQPLRQFDQGYVTPDVTLARVAFLWDRGDLVGKDIIVLGDDDLVSLALALTRQPRRIVVREIDLRLTDFIAEVKAAHGLNTLEIVPHDLRNPLPDALCHAFDVFLTDPTESLVGFRAFVERGLLALRGAGGAGYFGLTHVESSLRKWHEIQRFLLDHGLVITDLRDGFNRYVNWGYETEMRSWDWLPVKVPPRETWYTSALYRVEWIAPQDIPNRRFEGNIFDDAETATT